MLAATYAGIGPFAATGVEASAAAEARDVLAWLASGVADMDSVKSLSLDEDTCAKSAPAASTRWTAPFRVAVPLSYVIWLPEASNR